MTHNFPYLKDSIFLKKLDEEKLKEHFVKLIILTFDEMPIQEIQGVITGGNFTLDGSSSMRRTGNLSMIADQYENDLTDTKHLLSINKKVEVLIGFTNTTNQYNNFPILWFPQGTYVIISPNIVHNASGVNISLTLHDKMALLNGECGGTLPASVIFSEVQDIDQNGEIQITKPTIYQIIQELVNHFGGQQLGKIIINDIDSEIKKVMKWTGSTPLYMVQDIKDGVLYAKFSTNYDDFKEIEDKEEKIKSFSYGQDVGYILTDFVYPDELIGNAGETVVTILDKIKNMLGNYEYFYDINGNFIFQEIKNYLNKSYSTSLIKKINKKDYSLIKEINENDYIVDYVRGKSVYTFEEGSIIQSYSNSPQYQQIKNDFLVWGKRTSITGQEIPIRYHLAIDKKPEIGNSDDVFFYIDPEDKIKKNKKPVKFDEKDGFPDKGEEGIYYYMTTGENANKIYTWSVEAQDYKETTYVLKTITTTDWRTELYLAGVNNQPFGLDSNYYYTELKNEWPKIYDVENGKFFDETIFQPSDIDFFLDFIDSPTAISEFGIKNIGRRTTTLVDNSINCIFQPENPDIVIIEAVDTEKTNKLRDQCHNRGQEYAQVRSEIYNMLVNGGALKSAYEEIKKELYQYTNYNEQISLTVLPVYYLEPNTRITVRDAVSGIYGDYIIKSISLPLDVNGVMNLSCTRALERI